jgi:hypothetical protein
MTPVDQFIIQLFVLKYSYPWYFGKYGRKGKEIDAIYDKDNNLVITSENEMYPVFTEFLNKALSEN